MALDLPRVWSELRRSERAGVEPPLALAAAVSALLVVPLVYVTGGTHLVYAHAAYLPIVVTGIVIGPRFGAGLGLLLGLGLGPWMPLDTAAGIAQSPANWSLRCLFFVLIGAVTGLLAERVRGETEERLRLQTLDPASHLPGRAVLERRLGELSGAPQPGPWSLIVLRLNTLGQVMEALGSEQLQALWREVVDRIARSRPPGSEAYRVHADQIALLLPSGPEQATETAYALVSALHPPVTVGDIPLELDATSGVTTLGNSDVAVRHDVAPLLTASLAAGRAHQLG